jgi:pseudouridine synthase
VSAERLQKILARAGVASRRGSEEYLRQGRVTVNGAVAGVGDKADPAHDAIKVDGRLLRLPAGNRYLLLNKPRGYLVTRSDPQGRPTVYDLLPAKTSRGLFPVGRLDFHSEGLLLLTDDGDLAQLVAHPRHGCTKLYRVRVRGRPDKAVLDRLRAGIVIDGRRTAPAKIRLLRGPAGDENAWLEVELGEGRSRQIREMFFRAGHSVKRLKRIAIGSLRDPRLKPGGVREVTQREVARLRRGGADPKEKSSRGARR